MSSNAWRLTGHRNEDLAEMLEDIEAGANPEALLQTVMGTTIELRAAAHLATVLLTDYSDKGDSGAEDEGEEGVGKWGEEGAERERVKWGKEGKREGWVGLGECETESEELRSKEDDLSD